MRHAPIARTETGLRPPERRFVAVLRAWSSTPDERDRAWEDLVSAIGLRRAGDALRGFFELRSLLDHHAWHSPVVLRPGAAGWSEDELSLARFVLAAAEQRRDVAMAEAGFIVSPVALLPLLKAAERMGLPLLCEECRGRALLRRRAGQAGTKASRA